MNDDSRATLPSKQTTIKETAKVAQKKQAKMTEQHKAALADGRKHASAVRNYLDALKAANAPRKRGRQRSPETIQARLDKISEDLANEPSALTEVQLIQERLDLQGELQALQSSQSADPEQFVQGFVESVKPYSDSKGITYAAWRELGVPANVLRQAGVSR